MIDPQLEEKEAARQAEVERIATAMWDTLYYLGIDKHIDDWAHELAEKLMEMREEEA